MGGFFFVFADWLEAHDAQVNSFPIPFPVVAMQLHNQMHDKPKVNRLYSENSPMTGTEIFVQYTRLICVCVCHLLAGNIYVVTIVAHRVFSVETQY